MRRQVRKRLKEEWEAKLREKSRQSAEYLAQYERQKRAKEALRVAEAKQYQERLKIENEIEKINGEIITYKNLIDSAKMGAGYFLFIILVLAANITYPSVFDFDFVVFTILLFGALRISILESRFTWTIILVLFSVLIAYIFPAVKNYPYVSMTIMFLYCLAIFSLLLIHPVFAKIGELLNITKPKNPLMEDFAYGTYMKSEKFKYLKQAGWFLLLMITLKPFSLVFYIYMIWTAIEAYLLYQKRLLIALAPFCIYFGTCFLFTGVIYFFAPIPIVSVISKFLVILMGIAGLILYAFFIFLQVDSKKIVNKLELQIEDLKDTPITAIPEIVIPQVTAQIPQDIPNEWEEYKRASYSNLALGNARFADFDDLEDHEVLIHSPCPPSNLFLAKLGKFHGYQEWISIDAKKGHLLTVAPSGKGKGIHTVIPNLLTYNGSVVCLDIKGENTYVTARTRSSFGSIFMLNPWNLPNIPNTCFNPLDMFKDKPQTYQTDLADILSKKMIYSVKGDEDHWITSARGLVKALILYIVNAEKFEGERHLPQILDLLCQDKDGLNETLLDMQAHIRINPIIGRQGAAMLGKAEADRSGIISTAQEQLDFLNDISLAESLKQTSKNFNIQDIKRKVTSIYLSIPPYKLRSSHKWLRVLIGCLFFEFTTNTDNLNKPVLFMLDEFPALGYMDEIKEAYAIMRGYNVCLWSIIQDFSQLKATYGEAYGTFIANAHVLQCFGTLDNETAKYISEHSGQTTQEYITYTKSKGHSDTEGTGTSKTSGSSFTRSESVSTTEGYSWGQSPGSHGITSHSSSESSSTTKGSSVSDSSSHSSTESESKSHSDSFSEGISRNLQPRNLLLPDDILRMASDQQILRIGAMPIYIAPKLAYFRDEHFKELAAPNPLIGRGNP